MKKNQIIKYYKAEHNETKRLIPDDAVNDSQNSRRGFFTYK